jgi:hypothetical protein
MDMFADPMAELLARIEALEAAVFAKAPKPAKVTPEEALSEAWTKWDRHRSGKKGWTADARTLSMRTLRKLAGTDGTLALAIVDQSIERGWTGLFPLKAQDGPQASQKPVQHKTVKQALTPTEDRLTAQLRWLRNQVERGVMTESEFNAEAEKARERMG